MAQIVRLPRTQCTDQLETRNRHCYNERIERLRKTEYPMLRGVTYLDHAGTTLPSRTLIRAFSKELESKLLGNPHSSSELNPNTSQLIMETTRLQVLDLFQANREHFDVVFVANATAGIKLITEAFTADEKGFTYYYHGDSHTSLVGIRELAHSSQCFGSDAEAKRWIDGQGNDAEKEPQGPTLFAYPAQSNMNGRRLPLSWASDLRRNGNHPDTYTLLDVAALVSTSPLTLGEHTTAPDFLVLSFYKMFGFPDLGALIVRKDAAHVFDKRKYFGGGTTDMITCTGEPWVARKQAHLHERLEDGSAPIRSILALQCAVRAHEQLFGGFDEISRHTGWLAECLFEKLMALRHAKGSRVCRVYKDDGSTYGDARTQGATIAFNICRRDGSWIGSAGVGQIAVGRGIHVRTGSLCNPAGMASALGLDAAFLGEIYKTGFRCGQEDDIVDEVLLGMVRVSFGAMSALKDVEVFEAFVKECILQESTGRAIGPEKGGSVLSRTENASKALRVSGNGILSQLVSCFMGRLERNGKLGKTS